METSQNKKKKLWGGRFASAQSPVTERLSASIHYDYRLYKQDIRGSIAHARMLHTMGILSNEDLKSIEKGLEEIELDIENGSFEFSSSLEDIHMNIEARLTEKIGDAGRRLHTGRSRNDQVSVDMRMYVKDVSKDIDKLLSEFIAILISCAEENIDAVMPGYTHLQVAQPVRFSHHICAYAWKFLRDRKRLASAFESADQLPLGCGALAGVNYKNDREFLKKELGFSKLFLNSMDAVSDRDFILDFLYFASVLGVHLSRFCEELVLWSTPEFSFIKLDDSVTTGSSIMPQKRNPDLAELIRGKSGRLLGNLVSILTLLKGLPMTYNRDLQEDKERLFDTIDTVELSLQGMIEMLKTMKVNTDRMKEAVYSNYSTATDLADYLVLKGVPFREAHEIVGAVVRHCEESGSDFFSLSAESLQNFSDRIEDDVVEVLNPESSTERKLSIGSTAKKEVLMQIDALRLEMQN